MADLKDNSNRESSGNRRLPKLGSPLGERNQNYSPFRNDNQERQQENGGISEDQSRKERLEEQRQKETQAQAKIGVAVASAYLTKDHTKLKDIKREDVKLAAKGAIRQAKTINPVKKFRQQRELKKAAKKEAKKAAKKVVKKILWKIFWFALPYLLFLIFIIIIFVIVRDYVCKGEAGAFLQWLLSWSLECES